MRRSLVGRRTFRTDSPPADGDHRALLARLGRVLTRIGRGDGAPPILPGGLPARWDDEAYVYLEAVLTQPIDFGADITVHDGRVFIRLEK
jgi:hypothetical protein